MSSARQQLELLLEFLLSPEGASLAFVAMLLSFAGVGRPLVAWCFLILSSLTASLSLPLSDLDMEIPALAPGLEQIRVYGRVVAIAGLGGALPFVIMGQRSSIRKPGPRNVGISLFAFQSILVLKYFEYRLISYGALSLITYVLMFFVLVYGQTKLVWSRDYAIFAIRVIAYSCALFMFGVIYQAFVNVSAMLGNSGRLQGLTTNPQHAATLLAAALPAIAGLLEIERDRKWRTWLNLGLLVLAVMLVVWTSSRTGVLMCAVGLTLQYRRQLHKMGMVALLCAGAVAGVSQFFSEYNQNSSMIVRVDDTRSKVWVGQFNSFLESPLFGDPFRGQNRLGIGENSWLSAASVLGCLGLFPLCAFGYNCLTLCRRCASIGRSVSLQHQRMCDCVIAGFGAIFVGSIFEGYLLGVVNFQLFAIAFYAMAGYALVEGATSSYSTTNLPDPSVVQPMEGKRAKPIPKRKRDVAVKTDK